MSSSLLQSFVAIVNKVCCNCEWKDEFEDEFGDIPIGLRHFNPESTETHVMEGICLLLHHLEIDE